MADQPEKMPPAESKPSIPAPGTLPKLPQTLFIMEKTSPSLVEKLARRLRPGRG